MRARPAYAAFASLIVAALETAARLMHASHMPMHLRFLHAYDALHDMRSGHVRRSLQEELRSSSACDETMEDAADECARPDDTARRRAGSAGRAEKAAMRCDTCSAYVPRVACGC